MGTRIVIVDDHAIVLKGIKALLGKESDLEVVGTGSSGLEGVQVCRKENPDVVIMDFSLTGISGTETSRRILCENPGIKILFFSMHADRDVVMGALKAGASGYVLKDSAGDDLVRALRTVVDGGVYLSPAIAGTVVDALRQGCDVQRSTTACLTDRECEILRLIADGFSTQEIAAQFHLSIKTIGTYRASIMQKLDVRGVAALTKLAIREGLTDVGK